MGAQQSQDKPIPLEPQNALLNIVIMAAVVALMIYVAMLLWNASLPKMFSGAKSVDFLTMLFFIVLLAILFPNRVMQKAGY